MHSQLWEEYQGVELYPNVLRLSYSTLFEHDQLIDTSTLYLTVLQFISFQPWWEHCCWLCYYYITFTEQTSTKQRG